MSNLRLGDYNRLRITKKVDFGLYLDGGPEGEILLPARYAPETYNIGDELDVFIYLDQNEMPVATTEKPFCKVGDFAYLEVAWVNEYGAFLNWGLMKDLFCPFREQKQRMEIGKKYIVHVHIDQDSYRIVASAKVERYMADPLDEQPDAPIYGYSSNTPVSILVWQKTDLGFKVIVDNRYPGLVYEKQVFKYIHTGDRMTAYIQNVRPDGKIDVMLQPAGRQQTLDFSDTLLQYLKDNNGKCDLGDKSDAEDIKRRFQVSKKTYKKAIGDLYKRHLIKITENGIELV
ncbi:MAG: GntR family transcriptional regulator [Prevotella sp.]|nr:GntR family transcriptional regulator [Prevotella sp.]